MSAPHDYSERVPFGSAYGVENLAAQKALRDASVVALDEAMSAYADFFFDDRAAHLAENHTDESARQVFATQADQPRDPFLVSEKLPEAFARHYATFDFLKNWILTISVVGWKLAQPKAHSLTNTAEELAMHTLVEDAIAYLDRVPDNPEALDQLRQLFETAFEDNDYLSLYNAQKDDLGDLDDWFRPFGSGVDRGVPHPFLLDGRE